MLLSITVATSKLVPALIYYWVIKSFSYFLSIVADLDLIKLNSFGFADSNLGFKNFNVQATSPFDLDSLKLDQRFDLLAESSRSQKDFIKFAEVVTFKAVNLLPKFNHVAGQSEARLIDFSLKLVKEWHQQLIIVRYSINQINSDLLTNFSFDDLVNLFIVVFNSILKVEQG